MAWNTVRFAAYFGEPFGGPGTPVARHCLRYFLEYVVWKKGIHAPAESCSRWAHTILYRQSSTFGERREPYQLGYALDQGFDNLIDDFAADFETFFTKEADLAYIRDYFPFDYFGDNLFAERVSTNRATLKDLAQGPPFDTLRRSFSGTPVASDEHALYIRRSYSSEFVIGQFTIHRQPVKDGPAAFFTLLTSSSNLHAGEERNPRRRVYIYAGDIATTDSILICVAVFWTDDLAGTEDLGPLTDPAAADTQPLFKRIDWLRAFNVRRSPDSRILAGVAFIRDGDQETAVSPFVGLPMAEGSRLRFEDIGRTHSREAIGAMIAAHVPAHLQPRAREQFAAFHGRERYQILL